MTDRPGTESLDLAVSDFGPIVEANVNLRPLTVFVGPSNTGKSYLAILLYAIHCFFGGIGVAGRRRTGWFMRGLSNARRSAGPLSAESIKLLVDWAETLSSALDGEERVVGDVLPEPVARLIRARFNDLPEVENAREDLDLEIARCFGVDANADLVRRPHKGSARIELRRFVSDYPPFEHAFTIPASSGSFRVSAPDETPLRFADIPAWHIQDALTEHAMHQAGRTHERHPMEDLFDSLSVSVMRYTLGPTSRPVRYLPADRTGVMHAHRVVVGSLVGRAARADLRPDRPLPVLSGVLADFLEQLIDLGGKRRRVFGLSALATRVEREILKGAVRIRQSETGYPSFLYRPEDWKDDLPLMNTSSMVSELAPVVLYLRDVVRPGDTLIIEEPESHLHPAMQVEFTRLLAAAVKAGVRVVITTHSEWVLEALANLVRLSALPSKQRKGIAGADIALTPHEVGAWLFRSKRRPRGTVVEEIPLDVEAGTFPAGYSEITENLYNDWARISNLAQEAADH